MSRLDREFVQSLADLQKPGFRVKWYLGAIVVLGAINYSEEIPNLYRLLLEKYIEEKDHYEETRKIKEATTKVCGIHGAAKTGTAIRAFFEATPDHLRDSTCYRDNDDPEPIPYQRGETFVKSIYVQNPNINTNEDYVRKCSPDYFHIVSKYFYPYIFSFDKILNGHETSQAIVSSLIGIDCHGQATNQMKGMMYNGATKEEVEMVRNVAVLIMQKLNIHVKDDFVAVPSL
ncbi:hypothetical protein BJ170DRAFT_611810 [Xylariales sp. AK1849]|nr:hypothetical protein BJ170DRAFT_611810 [Xylariales sp. AK1849]